MLVRVPAQRVHAVGQPAADKDEKEHRQLTEQLRDAIAVRALMQLDRQEVGQHDRLYAHRQHEGRDAGEVPACVVWRGAGTHKLLVKFAIAWRDVSGMTDSIATRAYIPIKRALRRKV